MNISKIVSLLLIIGSLALTYTGYNKISQNTTEVNILGAKLHTSNDSVKMEGYLFLSFATLALIGGIYNLNKSKD